MLTADQVLFNIQEISNLYSHKHPLLHVDSLIGQLRISRKELKPIMDELAEQKLINFHQSTQDLLMLTEAGKNYTSVLSNKVADPII